MFVLPRRIAPAMASRAAASLSSFGTQFPRIFEPAVVRTPRVWKLSFSEMGMPKRRLFRFAALPRLVRTNSRSAERACFRALSASTVRKAFMDGFSFSMRDRDAFTRSNGEISLRRNRRAACSIERNASSDSDFGVTRFASKNLLRSTQCSGGAYVGDAENHKILVLIANRAK